MKVKTYGDAWTVVKEMTNTAMVLDNESSERAGYKVYRSENEYYEYVCDLGDKLELNKADGSTVNIWYGEEETVDKNDVFFNLVKMINNNYLNTLANNADAEVQIYALELCKNAMQIIIDNRLSDEYKKWCEK